MSNIIKRVAMTLALAPLLLILTAHVSSQSIQVTDRLVGAWQGEGKAFGMDAKLESKWEWVLDKKFLRLSLKSEMRAQNGQTQVFEGHAYYRLVSDNKYVGRWFDSRGVSFPIDGQVIDNSLVALWGSPSQEEGKSVYKITAEGDLEVIDLSKQKDGTYKEFGRVMLKKQ